MESTRNFTVLGAMSGTSLDGLDLVLVRFEQNSTWQFSILKSETISYTPEWKSKLSGANSLSGLELKMLDLTFAQFCGETINIFICNEQVDLIASHGHTVFHDPNNQMTHQIGDPSVIAAVTGRDVVADFRMKDVRLGGQGAPLVPIGDTLLFSEYQACVNLGGFANVSMTKGNKRLAWDISAANIVLNELVQPLGLSFDEGGALARKGVVNTDLLTQLEGLPYFKRSSPKSLGREWVEEEVLPLLKRKLPTEDLLATFTEHIALRVASDLSDVYGQVLFTGGGVYNAFLMDRIEAHGDFDLVLPSSDLIEFKEALIFAFLGVLWKKKMPNVLSEVTGACRDHISGVFVRGK